MAFLLTLSLPLALRSSWCFLVGAEVQGECWAGKAARECPGQGFIPFPCRCGGVELHGAPSAGLHRRLRAELQILRVPLSQGVKHVPISPARSQARCLRVLGTAGVALSRRGWVAVLPGPCHTACHISVSQEAAS